MSLAIGFASKNNAIIMSDGRAGENGCYSEHYDKTMRINDNIILGFAGIKENIEKFLSHIIKEMGKDRNNYFIEDFLEMIEFIIDDETKKRLESYFIIIGRTKEGVMVYSIIGCDNNYKIEKHIAYEERCFSIGGTIDAKIIGEISKKNMANKLTPIPKRMEKTIQEVAELDRSVNTNIFFKTI